MIVKTSKPFFSAPAGSTLMQIPDTRMRTVCDVCGAMRFCDWFEWSPEISGMTGMDICPSCSRTMKVKE